MLLRGTLVEAKEFARLHGGWIAARLGRLPKAASSVDRHRGSAARCTAPDRASRRRARHGVDVSRDSGEKILCVAGGVEHMDRRVHDFLKREARKDLSWASLAYAQDLALRSSGYRSAIS